MKLCFQSLSDSDLLTQTASQARAEKAATLTLLEHLAEVDERRAYATLAYSSLFDYVVRGLGYSESQASERVNAVRLLRQNTGVREHLNSGSLTLTAAAQIQRFVVAEKRHAKGVPPEDRKQVIEACLNRSKREVEKILFQKSSDPGRIAIAERLRAVSEELHELKLILNEEQMRTLTRARELFPDDTIAGLMARALKGLITEKEKHLGKKNEKMEEREDATGLTPPAVQPARSGIGVEDTGNTPGLSQKQLHSRYIPRAFKRVIHSRSGGQCEFVSKITNQRCRSRSRLQVDHIQPMAFGGKTELPNLRHLCATHNLQRLRRGV
jgi:hypothetical protein